MNIKITLFIYLFILHPYNLYSTVLGLLLSAENFYLAYGHQCSNKLIKRNNILVIKICIIDDEIILNATVVT
jgi:hypothetical protein